jgi:hypothetical protein
VRIQGKLLHANTEKKVREIFISLNFLPDGAFWFPSELETAEASASAATAHLIFLLPCKDTGFFFPLQMFKTPT